MTSGGCPSCGDSPRKCPCTSREMDAAEFAATQVTAEFTEKINAALDVARNFDADNERRRLLWVIDQMVRALTGHDYAAFVASAKMGEDGPETYDWDEGVSP